jgi:hypothetical protein
VRRWRLGSDGGPDVARVGCAITAAVVPRSADQVVAACAAGRVVGWDFDRGELWSADPGLGSLWDAVPTPDGRSIVLANRDGAHPLVGLLDLATQETAIVDAEHRVGYRAAVSADGKWFAVGDHPGHPRGVSAEPPYEAHALEVSREVVVAVALSADGSVLAAGDHSGTAHLWDVRRGEELAAFELHDLPIADLAWAPGTRTLVSASGDGTVRQLDLDAGARAAAVGASQEVGADPQPDGARQIELARLAEARGSWSTALALYRAAAAAGAPVRHVDLARALGALGRPAEADAELALAEDAREGAPGTLAAWRRALTPEGTRPHP